MTCGMCPFNDGMCYTSNPPKRKCTITGEFHFYDDECNCVGARLCKELERASLDKSPTEPVYLNIDGSATGDIYGIATTSITTPCIICGEDVAMDIVNGRPGVCDRCKEAVQFVKDKLMGE